MNKNKKKIHKKRNLAAKQQEENEQMCQSIRLHSEHLAEELNLRLLLESDIRSPLIYVESAAVTEICFPDRAEKFWEILLRKVQYIGKCIRSFLKHFSYKQTGSIHKSR